MNNNFKIGQKVVALFTWPNKNVIKGEIYTISNIIENFCPCNPLVLQFKDCGMSYVHSHCYKCNKASITTLFNASYFKPLQYDTINLEIIANMKLVEERSDIQIKELEKHD